ncbi:hypothetical protein [Microbacterium oxydans]|uniref:hypothetical protein n=1 Tax=Microbacterium oxydans TaxID=82380 RepID=UPI0037C8F02F
MTVNNYDPVTGRPNFSDNDAPDIKVDPGAVAEYAEEVGNRIVKANLAALNLYPYKRAGLSGHALDTKTDYVHNGTGWVVSYLPDTGWVNLTLNPNWSAYTGPETPKFRVVGGNLSMVGRVNATSGAGTVIGVLPNSVRPTSIGFLSVFTGWSDSHGVVQLLIGHASGEVVLVQGAGASRTGVSLAGIRFPVG